SSTVWWASMCRSPLAWISRSIKPCRAIWSSIWSRNGTPVSTFSRPVPSRLTATRIWVSLVFRVIAAVRRMGFEKESVFGKAVFGAGGMGLQAFAVGELGGDLPQRAGAFSGDLDQAGAFLEIVHPERRGKPRRA